MSVFFPTEKISFKQHFIVNIVKFIKFLLGPLIYFLKDPANDLSELHHSEMKRLLTHTCSEVSEDSKCIALSDRQ